MKYPCGKDYRTLARGLPKTRRRSNGPMKMTHQLLHRFPFTHIAEHLLSNPGAVGLQMGCAEHRPNIRLSETAAEYVLLAELPGVAEKDLQIQLKKNVLKISGEFQALQTDGQEALVSEINCGKFLRAMALPGPISAKKVSAKLNSGILEVRLPKEVKDDDVKVISLANQTAAGE